MYEVIRSYRQIESWVIAAYPVSGSTDAATTAWVAAVISGGGTVSAGRQTLVNDLIVGLKADGVWALLDRLWLFAAENATSALTDLVATDSAAEVSSPTFAADTGYTSAGSGSYVDSNFNPATAGGLYTQNDAHHSVWCVSTANSAVFIAATADAKSNIYAQYIDNNAYFRINHDSAGGFAVANARGFYTANRSGANDIEGYKDGSSLGSQTPVASEALAGSGTFRYGELSNAQQFAAASIGGSLDATEAAALYARVRTYMTAVGVP